VVVVDNAEKDPGCRPCDTKEGERPWKVCARNLLRQGRHILTDLAKKEGLGRAGCDVTPLAGRPSRSRPVGGGGEESTKQREDHWTSVGACVFFPFCFYFVNISSLHIFYGTITALLLHSNLSFFSCFDATTYNVVLCYKRCGCHRGPNGRVD
jgi:hypothetical protein